MDDVPTGRAKWSLARISRPTGGRAAADVRNHCLPILSPMVGAAVARGPVARSRAIDRLRRSQRRPDRETAAQRLTPTPPDEIDELAEILGDDLVADDQLSLILLCCHPALGRDAQVALTLRTVAGLTTDEIARGFMVSTHARDKFRGPVQERTNVVVRRWP